MNDPEIIEEQRRYIEHLEKRLVNEEANVIEQCIRVIEEKFLRDNPLIKNIVVELRKTINGRGIPPDATGLHDTRD